MLDRLKDLERLLPLLDMAYQAEQMKMAKALSRIRGLKDQLVALERPNKSTQQNIDAATLAGADLLWETWAQDRKSLINRELILAYQHRETVKSGLAKALAKLEAAKQVHDKVKYDVKQTQERRANW